MTEENKTSTSIWDYKTPIIAAVIVVLAVILMHFYDQKQQQAYELRRLERRVEVLEEWENKQGQLPPPPQRW
ncbi:MAG: hypothetical protein ACYSTN_07425 [Planctomycetota bacterium]|jgi:hypothetical protein